MKAFFIASLSLLTGISCFGQVVDGVTIDTLNTTYCQLTCEDATGLTRARIQIDYGQRYVFTGFNRQKIGNAQNPDIHFNSGVDALNFMDRSGWELVKFTMRGDKSVYLLRRKRQ